MNYIYPQKEFFKNIPGIPNYLVSNYGRVKSKYKMHSEKFDDTLMKPHIKKKYKLYRIKLDGKNKDMLIHRLMLRAFPCNFLGQKGIYMDHIDINPANNSLPNLRKCTPAENTWNIFKKIHTSSKYKGVHFHIGSKKWISRVHYKNREIHLGVFKSEIEAAKLYDDVAGKLFGDFARLNFASNSCIRSKLT